MEIEVFLASFDSSSPIYFVVELIFKMKFFLASIAPILYPLVVHFLLTDGGYVCLFIAFLSPPVVDLTLIDLPGMTKVAIGKCLRRTLACLSLFLFLIKEVSPCFFIIMN